MTLSSTFLNAFMCVLCAHVYCRNKTGVCFSCPTELGISSVDQIVLNELHEGAETGEFWEGLGGRKRLAYDSLLIGICFISH